MNLELLSLVILLFNSVQQTYCCMKKWNVDTEFLYISDSQIHELPSFPLTTSCQVPPHPIPGLGAVAGLSDGSLVICGGKYDNTVYSSCHTLSDNGWVKTDSLQDTAYYAAASQTTDGLVVTGGWRGRYDYLSTTQTLSGGRWTTGPQLPVKMSSHCQVTVRSSVLVAGGYNGDDESADVFKLEGGRWSKLQSMKTPRYGHACAVYQEEVYAIGGFDTNLVEIFNITSNTWRYGPQLPDRSDEGQAVVTSGALYYIDSDGKVVNLASDWSRWEDVTSIDSAWGRFVFPAPVVTRHNLKC